MHSISPAQRRGQCLEVPSPRLPESEGLILHPLKCLLISYQAEDRRVFTVHCGSCLFMPFPHFPPGLVLLTGSLEMLTSSDCEPFTLHAGL